MKPETKEEFLQKPYTPQVVTNVEMAFPASVSHLMPKREDIPEQYEGSRVWLQWQNAWFSNGIERLPVAKPGVDLGTAMRHLSCVQGSFHHKHEYKMEAVAYLASLWFSDPDGPTYPASKT